MKINGFEQSGWARRKPDTPCRRLPSLPYRRFPNRLCVELPGAGDWQMTGRLETFLKLSLANLADLRFIKGKA
jgi:hypothetical protein